MYKDELRSIERFASGVLKLGVLLVFLNLLFITKNHLAPFHFGKLTAFRIIISVMVFFYVVLLYLDKERYRPRIANIGLALLAYSGIIVLTSFTGEDFRNSFWGSIERMGGLYNYLFYIAFFVMLSGLFKEHEDWKKLLQLSACFAAAMAFYGMGQMLWLGDFFLGDLSVITRPVGTTGNALFFGTYLLWHVFIFGLVIYFSKKRWQKILFGALGFYSFIMFFTAQARGAFVGLLAGVLAVVAILAVLSGSRKVKAVSLAVVLLVVVAAGSLIILRDNPIVKNSRYLNRFSDISWSSGTMGTRLLTWSSGWKGFLDKPILGNGMENFIYAFSRYYRPEHFGGYGSETWFDRAHNAHLDVLVESGVVGAIGYAALWGMSAWFLLKQAYKKREELVQYALLFGALTAYMVQSFTIFNTYTGYITMFLFLAYVNYLQYSETKGPDEAKEVKEDINERSLTRKQIKKMKREGHLREESRTYGQPNYVVLGVIGVLVILGIVFIDVPSVYQNYYAGQAQAAAQSGRLELAAPLFKKAFANNSPIGETEIAEYLAKFSVERAAAKDMDQKATEEALRFAIETEERVHEKHPVDVKVMLILGRMYNMYGEFAKNPEDYYKKAVAVIKKAMEYSPTREQLYFELGQSYVLLHDVEGGVAVYRKGLELTPTVGVSNYYYGMSVFNWYKKLKADGDAAAAAEKLDEAVEYMDKAIKYGHFNQAAEGDLRRMSVVYGEAKQYNKLAEVFNQILKKNPKNKDIISQLAMTYKEMGDKEKARETAERLRKLDPTENELQQLEGFLQSLQ